MSDFDGLRIALSSLYAQRRALDVTAQNVANVNTEGYSRQRVDMQAVSGPTTAAIHARWDGTGMGVKSSETLRLRDQFMDMRGYQEHALDSSLRRTQGILARVELAFDEPSDTGLGAVMEDFWGAWNEVANHPDDLAARSQLVEQGHTLGATIAQLDGAIAGLGASSLTELGTLVDQVNATASRIAELNDAIASNIHAGFTANELMDQRDRLVGELAEQVGATARPSADGRVDVFIAGTALVRDNRAETLALDAGNPPAVPARIVWEDDGYLVAAAGAAGALLGAVNDVLPRYRAGLADLAQAIADDVNALHSAAFALDGSTGHDFFTITPSGALTVNAAVVADHRLVAASGSATAGRDGSVAAQLAALTRPGVLYEQLVGSLGIETQAVNRRVDLQAAIVRQVDGARDAAAGVNLDEEMTAMVMYQHAYDAAARMLTAVDEMLDTLINRTGLAGR